MRPFLKVSVYLLLYSVLGSLSHLYALNSANYRIESSQNSATGQNQAYLQLPFGYDHTRTQLYYHGKISSSNNYLNESGITISQENHAAVPELQITEFVIESIIFPPGYTGPQTKPVPGTKIKYKISLINLGSQTAKRVDLKQTIPAQTSFYAIESDSDIQEMGGILGAASDIDYQVSANYLPNPPANLLAVKGIRFNLPNMAIGESKTLKYSVIVK